MSKATKRERQKENRERAREERERLLKRDRRMKALRSVLFLLVPLVVIAIIINVTSSDNTSKKSKKAASACGTGQPVKNPTTTYTTEPPMTVDTKATYSAAICTSEGEITLNLDAKAAPIATNSFVFLAEHGFYDGQTFHRAAKNFVIQGGDPKGDGSGGPGYKVAGEVPKDHYPLGSLAAAKSGAEAAGTFGSQFFIVTGSGGATLPNDYARFGTVTTGLKVAQKIEKFAPASGDGAPTKPVKIIKVVIKRNGVLQGGSAAPASPSSTVPASTSSAPSSTTSSSTP